MTHHRTNEHYARVYAGRYSERIPHVPLIIITILGIMVFGACAFAALPVIGALINTNNAIVYPTPAPFTPLPPSPSPTPVYQPAVFVTATAGSEATTIAAPNTTPRPSLPPPPTSQPATPTPNVLPTATFTPWAPHARPHHKHHHHHRRPDASP